MNYTDDPRKVEANSIPVADLLVRLNITGLRQMSGEWIGPCPLCGGTDRFGINIASKKFNCRKCDLRGADPIALTMAIQNINFLAALTFLCGDAPVQRDPAEMERRRKRAAAAERAQRQTQERYRQSAIKDAQRIWAKSRPGHLGVVRAYLNARGITPDLLPDVPDALRFIVDHPYNKKMDGNFSTIHRGPCVIAAILNKNGELTAVHQTWVDINPPHGKAKIIYGVENLPAKMVRGSKKGGAIRLHTPQNADTLIMGEGIETTLSAMVARPVKNAAYWAGVDLGNMAGRMHHVRGQRFSGVPDLADRHSFVPPPSIKRLVFIMDGDSEPAMTRAKLECGLRRAMAQRADLRGQIVQAADGMDLNDMLAGVA